MIETLIMYFRKKKLTAGVVLCLGLAAWAVITLAYKSATQPIVVQPLIEPTKAVPSPQPASRSSAATVVKTKETQAAPEASENTKNYTVFTEFLQQSFRNSQLDENLGRQISYKIKELLQKGGGSETDVVEIIKEELPNASEEEVGRVQSAISVAVENVVNLPGEKPTFEK